MRLRFFAVAAVTMLTLSSCSVKEKVAQQSAEPAPSVVVAQSTPVALVPAAPAVLAAPQQPQAVADADDSYEDEHGDAPYYNSGEASYEVAEADGGYPAEPAYDPYQGEGASPISCNEKDDRGNLRSLLV